ncbi:MAG: hypothetical protein VKJ46_09550 [Leptolyngbyaceae bacterium]|nr:hypothetical protein [Leptolyngbyaceae bacterium]
MKTIDWYGYRLVAWGGIGGLAVSILAAALLGNWTDMVGLIGFLGAALVFMLLDNRLPSLFDFLFVLAALLNAGGWIGRFFYQPGPYDEITHAFTIFAFTLALSYLVYRPMFRVFHQYQWLYILTITSFGISLGALWEIGEWLAGLILRTEVIESLDDTITDLVMDSIGAGLAAFISLWVMRQRIHQSSNHQSQRSPAPSISSNAPK